MRHLNSLKREQVEYAVLTVNKYLAAEGETTKRWLDYSEGELWCELVCCILGSRVPSETATSCTLHLDRIGLLGIPQMIRRPREIEKRLAAELNKPIFAPCSGGRKRRYRHPKGKSRLIVRTAMDIYKHNGSTMKEILRKSRNPHEARTRLVRICSGVGPKQASLFLTNISYCDNLAVLDSHVMRYIRLMGLDDHTQLFHPHKKNRYLANENALSMYAIANGTKLATLDTAIWVVMRVAKREFGTCQS